jgi:hypothetical protein
MGTVVNHTQVRGYHSQPSKRSAGNGGKLASTNCVFSAHGTAVNKRTAVAQSVAQSVAQPSSVKQNKVVVQYPVEMQLHSANFNSVSPTTHLLHAPGE